MTHLSSQTESARSFRLVCPPEQTVWVEELLRVQGYEFAPEPFLPLARRLLREPEPLGSSLAAQFGYIYIQDRSSMLPPVALNLPAGAAVLDMCASPGSKTGLLGQMVGASGFVLGNEPSTKRLATLRHNMQLLNLLVCTTCSHPGEGLPFPSAPSAEDALEASWPGWEWIQLDPPCSGWGTVEKHPQVTQLWHGDKVQPLIALQRKLLTEAARLLRPGGSMVYSTCTTNVEENESQIRFAREELGLMPVPLAPPSGFTFAASQLPDIDGVLRVENGTDGQGFFVARLCKPAAGASPSSPAFAPASAEEPATIAPGAPQADFFVRPWEKESRFVGERRRHGKPARRQHEALAPIFFSPDDLAGPYLNPAQLPDGDIAAFGYSMYFLPAASRALVPAGFTWKGFPLGRLGANGRVRTSPNLRSLMPTPEALAASGIPALVLDDITPLARLLSGQGLAVNTQAAEIGLYFKGLPLCRLSVKGKRAILGKR